LHYKKKKLLIYEVKLWMKYIYHSFIFRAIIDRMQSLQ